MTKSITNRHISIEYSLLNFKVNMKKIINERQLKLTQRAMVFVLSWAIEAQGIAAKYN